MTTFSYSDTDFGATLIYLISKALEIVFIEENQSQ